MNKEEFLRQLEQLLSGISEEERADAIAFYRSYFEDAGEANEASILEELESPQKVAESIRKNLGIEETCTGEKPDGAENYVISQPCADGDSAGDGTCRNENAGNEYGRNKDAGNGYDGNQYGGNGYGTSEYGGKDTSGEKGKKDHTAAIVLAVIVAVLTSPIWLALLLALVGVLLAVIAVLFAVAVAVVAVMASLVFVGFLLMGIGISLAFTGNPPVGVGLFGGGLIVLALGILAVLLVVWVFGAFLPWAFKGIWHLCRKPFDKRKERADV